MIKYMTSTMRRRYNRSLTFAKVKAHTTPDKGGPLVEGNMVTDQLARQQGRVGELVCSTAVYQLPF
jgi:hypothetical protein